MQKLPYPTTAIASASAIARTRLAKVILWVFILLLALVVLVTLVARVLTGSLLAPKLFRGTPDSPSLSLPSLPALTSSWWSAEEASFPLLHPNKAPGADNPFLIEDVDDVYTLAEVVNQAQTYTIEGLSAPYANADYRLENDIDFTKSSLSAGSHFTPIGTEGHPFRGTFNGNHHTLFGLTIRGTQKTSHPNTGLFGVIWGTRSDPAAISNLTLHEVKLTNNTPNYVAMTESTGGLVGMALRNSQLKNISIVGGTIRSAGNHVGSLAGFVGTNSHLVSISASGRVEGSGSYAAYVGGLVGFLSTFSTLTSSVASTEVWGSNLNVGGLVGRNLGTIARSRASGNVSGRQNVGGLVGQNEGRIVATRATGAVDGEHRVGGLVGENVKTITTSYAPGKIFTESPASARAGNRLLNSISIHDGRRGVIIASYATGRVTSDNQGGGLIGVNVQGNILASYWDILSSTMTSSAGGAGVSRPQMQTPTAYTGIYADWNVDSDGDGSSDDPWDFGSSHDSPILKNLPIFSENSQFSEK